MNIEHNHLESQMILNHSKYSESFVKLANSRTIFLNEDFSKKMAAELIGLLAYYDNESNEKDITIYINSQGGSADAILSIVDVIGIIKAPIKTIGIGKVFSAGSILLSCGTKGKRFMFKHSKVLIHGLQCLFPIPGENSQQSSKEYLNHLNKSNDIVMKIMAEATGQTFDKIKQDCLKDNWLDSKQSVAYGLIDHII